jgi:hypothetical protein
MNQHWKVLTPSQFEWERRALDFVRAGLPDHDPYRAWANFEFQTADGALYEVDLLVLTKEGFWLVEVKSRPGRLEGDAGTWTWTTEEGRRITDDNPRSLAGRKAKALKSLLLGQPAVKGVRVPYLDLPQRRGLPEAIENLLILVYALQTNRSFFRHGVPYEASLDRLPGELELRALPLPSAEEWETAKQRAAALFEIEVNGPLTWTNVGQLASEVRAKVEAGQAAGGRLAEQVSSAASRLGVPVEQVQAAARYRTAGAVGQLLQSLHRREPTPCVKQLALARIETSAAAMAKSLASAADVLDAIQEVPWSLLDSLGRITDERQPQAAQVLQSLREALLADEHVSSFALALRDARDEAYRLLAQAPGQPTPVQHPDLVPGPVVVTPTPGEGTDREHVIDQGQQSGLNAEGLAGLVAELTRRLQQDARLRLEVRWVLRKEGNQP